MGNEKSQDPRWDLHTVTRDPAVPGPTLREGLISSGNRTFDMDALAESEYGLKYLDGLEPIFLSSDPMDEKVLSYWRDRGLQKELVHGQPRPWNDWTFFIPLSAMKPENRERKYPMVIGLHGGAAAPEAGEPVFMAESSCYARKAAEEEFILAMPEDHDAEPVLALYQYAVSHYPVDRTRVYLAGFSAGGDRSCRAALRYPELFAGMCIGAGVPFNLFRNEDEIRHAEELKMPFIAIGCLSDKGNHTPLYRSNPIDNPVPDFIAKLLSGEGKMGWINTFFDINHVDHPAFEDTERLLLENGTPQEKRIGMCAHRSGEWTWAGARHLWLDYTDREGIDSVRYVFVEGLPHTEPVDMMDMAWPYLKRFSRDPEDGSLRCDDPRCPLPEGPDR